MKIHYSLLFFLCLPFMLIAQQKATVPDFMKHIKFNHLFIVIDSISYQQLSDSIPFINNFSTFKETKVNAGSESWSGKYLIGQQHYLEIFKPEGYTGARQGDFGMGFMPDKMGTLDALYQFWSSQKDSVKKSSQEITHNGNALPWYSALSLPNTDSLPMSIWLMENSKEEMQRAGFTEDELKEVIEYREYFRRRQALSLNISPDSVIYNKLFDKVNTLHLTLTTKELDYLRQHLTVFGFREENNHFYGNDLTIAYRLSDTKTFMLQQIDFRLMAPVSSTRLTINNIEISAEGNSASFRFTCQ